MGDPAEREKHPDGGHAFEFRKQELAAGGNFRRHRLVGRRNASDRIDDPAIDEAQSILWVATVIAFRETRF